VISSGISSRDRLVFRPDPSSAGAMGLLPCRRGQQESPAVTAKGKPMTGLENEQGSPFWRFSLGFYRRPGVAEACLALQDRCGVDVNLLLLFLWLATLRKRLPPQAAGTVCARAERWREDVVKPLRAVRRRLKEASHLVDPAAAEAFRTRVKVLELESERLQQEALFALAEGLTSEEAATVEAAARANVAAYAQASGQVFDASALDRLFAALGDPG